MTTVALLAASLAAPSPVELYRQYKVGERLEYKVTSTLLSEQKEIGMTYFLPTQMDINYSATLLVKSMKNEGFAEIEYTRPTMTYIDGETADRPPKTTVEKTAFKFLFTLSPINELTATKRVDAKSLTDSGPSRPAQIQDFTNELYRMALFIGGIDSALELSPKLPIEEVSPGDTWKRTIGYQPAQLEGTDRHAMQRLDYTFTYIGVAELAKQKVHHLTGEVIFESDAAPFIHQVTKMKPEDTGLKAIKLNLKMKADYYLDFVTKKTLRADAKSEGGYTVEVTDEEEPILIEKFKGTSSLRLAGQS